MKRGLFGFGKSSLMFLIMLGLVGYSQAVYSETITFDEPGISQAQIIDNEFSASKGVTFSAVNAGVGTDLVVAYASDLAVTGFDTDLVGPPWSGGNLAPNTVLGNIIVIEENDFNLDGDNFVTTPAAPDDEGSRPAGSIFLEFGNCIEEFGMDMIDVEDPENAVINSAYIAFFNNNDELARVEFEEFVDNTSMFFDPTVAFVNHYANRINPITLDELEAFTGDIIFGFNKIELNLGGSGGFDNLSYEFCRVIGGNIIEIDTTSLLLAGVQTNLAWMIPFALSAAGIGIFLVRKKF